MFRSALSLLVPIGSFCSWGHPLVLQNVSAWRRSSLRSWIVGKMDRRWEDCIYWNDKKGVIVEGNSGCCNVFRHDLVDWSGVENFRAPDSSSGPFARLSKVNYFVSMVRSIYRRYPFCSSKAPVGGKSEVIYVGGSCVLEQSSACIGQQFHFVVDWGEKSSS